MISCVRIRNFQSHEETDLDLHPGVNVIVGTTDSGKSVIMRALGWVAFNKPRGADFRSHWGGETVVEIEDDEGTTVSRVRTTSKNLYFLDGEELKSFGTGVPEEVERVLLLEDVNYQSQHDPPFMLSDSPIVVARRLNKIANLDIIDDVSSRANSEKLKALGDIMTAERAIKKYTEALEVLPNVEADAKLADKVRERLAKHADMSKRATRLEGVIASLGMTDEELAKKRDTEPARKMLARVNSHLKRVTQGRDRFRSLTLVCKQIIDVTRDLNDLHIPDPETIKVLKDTKLPELLSRAHKLQTVINDITTGDVSIKWAEEELDRLEAQYELLMPDICPLCGQEVSK